MNPKTCTTRLLVLDFTLLKYWSRVVPPMKAAVVIPVPECRVMPFEVHLCRALPVTCYLHGSDFINAIVVEPIYICW